MNVYESTAKRLLRATVQLLQTERLKRVDLTAVSVTLKYFFTKTNVTALISCFGATVK